MITERLNDHATDKTSAIYDVISKYGKDNFTISLIDTAENQLEADQKEVYWTLHINQKYALYNKAIGNFKQGFKGEVIKENKNVTFTGKKYRTDCYCDPARYNYSEVC